MKDGWDKMTIENKYTCLCNTPSDINLHLPTLMRYGYGKKHVTEMGVRYVVSTFAFLMGRPKRLVSIDIEHPNNVEYKEIRGEEEFEMAERYARENNVDFEFRKGDTLEMEIEETDVLFIDTLHCYRQLSRELELHSKKVREYILLHDTSTYGYVDERPLPNDDRQGLVLAVNEFLSRNSGEWMAWEQYFFNNGLIVLRRI